MACPQVADEEMAPPIWMVAANLLNKVSGRADKAWSSSLSVGQGTNNSSLLRRRVLRNIAQGLGLILWYDAPVVKERETHTGFWWEDLKETDHPEDHALMKA
jgi:hypothetical protein